MKFSGQLHTPTPLPQGKNPNTHSITGFLGPRAGLNALEMLYAVYFRSVSSLACVALLEFCLGVTKHVDTVSKKIFQQ